MPVRFSVFFLWVMFGVLATVPLVHWVGVLQAPFWLLFPGCAALSTAAFIIFLMWRR